MSLVRVIVCSGWIIDTTSGTGRPGQVIKLDAKAAQHYLAVGAVKRARWWQ